MSEPSDFSEIRLGRAVSLWQVMVRGSAMMVKNRQQAAGFSLRKTPCVEQLSPHFCRPPSPQQAVGHRGVFP
ncbi:MAG: hypothetical protein PVI07_01325 [Anaerolineae bacterium]|jgi:hypothetical protein